MTTSALEATVDIDKLFDGIAAWRIPGIADRYDYKKDPGSSDTRHQEDDIRT